MLMLPVAQRRRDFVKWSLNAGDKSRDNAAAAGDEDWLKPEGGDTAVDRSTEDVPMQSEPPKKFCTRCNQEGHCAGDGCPAVAPDAAPRPNAAAVRPEAGSKPVSRARWGTSAPRTEWPDKPGKTEAAAGTATGSASSAGDHRGAFPAEQDDPMPPLIPLPTVANAAPISSWPAPDFDPWNEGTRPRSGDWPPDFGPPDLDPMSDDMPPKKWVEHAAWRALREQDEYDLARHRIDHAAPAAAAAAAAAAPAATAEAPVAAVPEPNPSEAPEMPDAPEEPSPFGIGTYDAARSKNKGKTKGKSKDKSKGKSKGKPKGKDRGSRSDSSHSAWGRMYDFWRYDSA